MQRLEVSCALWHMSLGAKGLNTVSHNRKTVSSGFCASLYNDADSYDQDVFENACKGSVDRGRSE